MPFVIMKPAVVDFTRVMRGAVMVMRAQADVFLDPNHVRRVISQSLVTPYHRPPQPPQSPSENGTAPPTSSTPPPPTQTNTDATKSPQGPVSDSPISPSTTSVKSALNSTPVSPSIDATASVMSTEPDLDSTKKVHMFNEDTPLAAESDQDSQLHSESDKRVMRERRVPQTAISRIAAFGGLGASLLTGAAAEVTRRAFRGRTEKGTGDAKRSSPFVTEANAHRLADTLSRMRGAALKLGQMLSIQDETVMPAELSAALQRVRQNADVMPASQLNATLATELGDDWREKFISFDESPMAAASIGQVHRATIRSDDNESGELDVVLKVQYPGVAESIQSDVDTLRRLLRIVNFVPDSYYVNEALEVAQHELHRECDYSIEAENQKTYRDLVLADPQLSPTFRVPKVIDELSTKRILTSEYVAGVPIDNASKSAADVRDEVATHMLRLTMRELFMFGFQQSDPNWANYLYDATSGQISLIDFGAARPYPDTFLQTYLQLIIACADRDEDGIIRHSIDLGFLTGEESRQMINAHIAASLAVGEPFQENTQGSRGFNFDGCDIPKRTSEFGKVMLDQRLTPPPKEAYSLHRRLSGAFLLGTKLRATVDARAILNNTIDELDKDGRLAFGT